MQQTQESRIRKILSHSDKSVEESAGNNDNAAHDAVGATGSAQEITFVAGRNRRLPGSADLLLEIVTNIFACWARGLPGPMGQHRLQRFWERLGASTALCHRCALPALDLAVVTAAEMDWVCGGKAGPRRSTFCVHGAAWKALSASRDSACCAGASVQHTIECTRCRVPLPASMSAGSTLQSHANSGAVWRRKKVVRHRPEDVRHIEIQEDHAGEESSRRRHRQAAIATELQKVQGAGAAVAQLSKKVLFASSTPGSGY
ncbi:hypothetical protein B0H17DRAFT_1135820 [Mycena rosella]|uniref:Uncharacterized protein n=1 Tax=Mycena rosella TaxID=1033263 RepID=A0AAD7GHG0_MYCRO|nr:hypothetical protein B0H17DRAFT_1135820 [Mycena rosella]